MEKEAEFVRWFSELSNDDVSIAGGKGASLAEMYNNNFPVPPGFVVTAEAYRHFIAKTDLLPKIKEKLSSLDIEDTDELEKRSDEVRKMIDDAIMPKDLQEAIIEAYDVLDVDKQGMQSASGNALSILKHSHEPPFVAVRSSATTEDLAEASFAGQQESFLNVKGEKNLIQKVKECFASLFTARAIYYRQKKGFAHDKSYLAVVVQRMIDSEKSGVMFTKNPTKDDDNIIIEAVFGLGEGIVSGRISPDHYVLNKELEVLHKDIVDKKEAIVRSGSGDIEPVKLTSERSNQQVLTGYELKRLAQFGMDLESHYKKPQDIEFAIEQGNIYIVQSRPITTKTRKNDKELNGDVLLSGIGASPGVGSGTVKIIHSLKELGKIKKGDVLVTTMTNPDMVVSMQKASAIITDEGGVTSHAAIVSREMGIPAVVGTRKATTSLTEGQEVTVDGSTGRVFEGLVEGKKAEILPIVSTRTKIKTIVDVPDYASRAAQSGVDGVGLVRLETIIALGGKHPAYYLLNNKLNEYIKLIYEGLKKIAIPFNEIWVRTSDIRSDEYRNLEDSPKEVEGNPMLGDHGIRFSLKNPDILEAECKAVKELADEFADKTFGLMIPQLISVEELQGFKKVINKVGVPSNIIVGGMIETPAAVQIIDLLCDEGLDFISFGTNDLTQYTLAIDRNNEEVQPLYNEMHPAVLRSLSHVIRVCKERGVQTSICGQAGSKEEMARFLVGEGIDSISVNADAAHLVSKVIASVESGETYHKHEKIMPKQHVEIPKNNKITYEEELVLKALDNADEYIPGMQEVKSDIPSLNDAIPIDSEDFEEEDKILDIF